MYGYLLFPMLIVPKIGAHSIWFKGEVKLLIKWQIILFSKSKNNAMSL